jgi:hypothetical protein
MLLPPKIPKNGVIKRGRESKCSCENERNGLFRERKLEIDWFIVYGSFSL